MVWPGLVLALAFAWAALAEAPAEAPAVAFGVGDSWVLVAADGAELVGAGQYSVIEPLTDRPPYFYAALQLGGEEPQAMKLLDAEGRPLTDFSYQYLAGMGDRICFGQDGQFGVMDASLNVVVPCAYTSIVDNGEGGYLALTTNPYDERADGVYYIDPDGKENATGIRVLYGLADFSEGLMPVLSADTGRTGYLNPRGEWAIPAQFSYAGAFDGGLADAAIDSGTGVIDTSGNWLITPKYEMLSICGATPLVVAQADSRKIALIDPKADRTIAEFSGEDIYFSAPSDSELVTLYLDGRLRLVDAAGNTVLETDARDASVDSDGVRLILREGPWGEKNVTLCDLTGKRLAGPYQDIWRVSGASDAPYYAFSTFDTQEETLDDGGYTYLNEVPDTRRTGLMDENGAVLWQMDDYRALYSPGDGLFTVQMPGKAGLMRADGSWLRAYDTAADGTE